MKSSEYLFFSDTRTRIFFAWKAWYFYDIWRCHEDKNIDILLILKNNIGRICDIIGKTDVLLILAPWVKVMRFPF